jgi:hypothetical protein
VDFSEARDLFVNIFQISERTENHGPRVNFRKTEGLLCKICKTGPRVDFGKTEGLLCKMPGDFWSGIIFQRINPWPGSTSLWTGQVCSVHRGPSPAWTEGTVARSPELGLQPLRCAIARRWGRNMERGATGTRLRSHWSLGGAVEAGRWWCRMGRRRCSVRRRLERGEKRREARRGAVNSRGGARLL